MPIRTILSVTASLLIVSPILISQSFAQSKNPAWTDKLSEQLAVEQECEVAFFTTVVETERDGKNFYAARSHCVDGRQFDGERLGDAGKFEIKACKVVVC